MDQQLTRLRQLSNEGKYEEALSLAKTLLTESPDNPDIHFEYACLLDGQGYEREAVSHYEQAIAGGLSGEELEMATINLGSTYRALGEYEQAVRVWRDGLQHFAENRALQVFAAMGLYNLGHYQEATHLLLRTIAETSNDPWLQHYRRAILFYADKLDKMWS
jgi:tetratricopeptide (TPR) repeat protein